MKHTPYFAALSVCLLLTACQHTKSQPEAAKPEAPKPAAPAAASATAPKPAAPAPAAPAPAAPAAAAAGAVAGEIIIDNGDSGGFKSEGTWSSATGGHDFKDEVVWATGTGANDPASTATWTPDIKVAGDYDVYEWHGDDPNSDHAGNAPFTVKYDGGSKTIPVDLRANNGKWNKLGTFKFAAGKSGSVSLSSKADGNVLADAIKFTPAIK